MPGDNLKFTGYDMTNGVNGNTGMDSSASNYGNGAYKYYGNTYLNGDIWFAPFNSDVMMKMDAITGKATGYLMTGVIDASTGNPIIDASVTANDQKYHGAPVYAAGYLWFAPYKSDRLLRLNPLDGSMVAYPVTGTGITARCNNATEAKFGSMVFDGEYLWMIPLNADRLVRVDLSNLATTGPSMTGYAISGPTITRQASVPNTDTGDSNYGLLYEKGAFDGKNLWLAPYGSNQLVKVSGLDSTSDTMPPVFTGYTLAEDAASGITSSCVGDTRAKFHDVIFDGANLWLMPSNADSAVKVSNLAGTPKFRGYSLADDVNGNVGMMDSEQIAAADKFGYSAFDGTYIWSAPGTADPSRLVRLDVSNGQMTGYTIPHYKSMTDDIPYNNPADTTDFHNYFNNNNWGMTDKTAYGYSSLCFDGYNIWLSPLNSDRVVKISPSVDEALSISADRTITADLTNYMIQENPYTGGTPAIQKIEWVRMDTPGSAAEKVAQIAQYTYKVTQPDSIYTDERNTASDAQHGFDYAFTNADAADKGTISADSAGDMAAQSLSFNAPASGTYYVKAYFYDPVNYYGENMAYNEDRGTPQMVCVIKEITVPKLTLHVRQVLLYEDGETAFPDYLDTPIRGYMRLQGYHSAVPATSLFVSNITTISQLEIAPQNFTDYMLDIKNGDQYKVTDIIPQYFSYVGNVVTYKDTQHLVADMDEGPEVLVDYTDEGEAWVTIYLRPASEELTNNEVGEVRNKLGEIEGVSYSVVDDIQFSGT